MNIYLPRRRCRGASSFPQAQSTIPDRFPPDPAIPRCRRPRALEALDHTLQQLEKGEINAIEAIKRAAERGIPQTARSARRIDVALRTAKLMPVNRPRCSAAVKARAQRSTAPPWPS